MAKDEKQERMSRSEAHDLQMIIKDRVKVLKAHADEQVKACMADFERHLSQIYKYDQDDVWKRATEEAMAEVAKAQEKIAARCVKLGIPRELGPRLLLSWESRGQQATAMRRSELRRVAESEVEAMRAAAVTKIEKQALDLRTQVVSLSVMTPEAKMFLESLAPIDDAMAGLDFAKIEQKVLDRSKNAGARRLGYGGLYRED